MQANQRHYAYVVILACLASQAGCEAPPAVPSTPPGGGVMSAIALTDAASPIVPNASYATYKGDWDRSPAEYYRSIRDLGWGSMRLYMVDAQGKRTRYTPSMPVNGDRMARLEATGLMPDGREFEFAAAPYRADQSVGETDFKVAIRIGPFGDRDRERDFLYLFASKLAGKPYPVRDRYFELPENVP